MTDYEALPVRDDFADPGGASHLHQHLQPQVKPKSVRVVSLDVFRGLCVLLMMLVDYGGAIFPRIAHAPWNGVHLADFVMPFFLFVAGVALAIVYKKVPNRLDATWKAINRGLKLFLLGVFLQGGYLHGLNSLTYGVDLKKLRWMGILQRISIAYVVTAVCEIWLPIWRSKRSNFFRRYFWQWFVGFLLSSTYIGLSYGLYVPDWQVKISEQGSASLASNGSYVYTVKCGVRASLGPACNSAGMIDRYVFGADHLYTKPAYKNLKECNKSKDGQVPLSAPSWCHAPFDPEGILGSLTATLTCIIGLQFGHVLVHFQDHKERLCTWSTLSVALSSIGFILSFLGIPLNKSLYTVSYSLLTSASAGVTFCALYLLVDVCNYRQVTYALEWMGIRALTIFILISSNIAVVVLQGFYWKTPENNLIHSIVSIIHR